MARNQFQDLEIKQLNDRYLMSVLKQYQQRGGFRAVTGYDFVDDALNSPSKRAKFLPRGGDTYEDWLLRLEKYFPGINFVTGDDEIYNKDHGDFYHQGAFDKYKANATNNPNHDPSYRYSKQTIDDYINSQAALAAKTAQQTGRGPTDAEAWKADTDWLTRQQDIYEAGVEGEQLQDEWRRRAGFKDPEDRNKVEENTPVKNPGIEPSKDAFSTDNANAALREYAEAMMLPLNRNSLEYKQISKVVADAAATQAENKGFGNRGLGLRHVENAVANAYANVNQQRSALGLQALGQSAGLDIQAQRNIIDAYNAQYNAERAAAEAEYKSRAQQAGSTGAILGAVGGGIIGAVTPLGVGQGVAFGSQVGAGLGTMSAGTYSAPAYSPPAYGAGLSYAPHTYRSGGG